MRIEVAHRVCETAVNGLSILFNLVLLYLIKNHSAFGTRVYQVMLTIDASLDLTLSIFALIGQPVCFTGGGYKEFISNGFFANRWYAFDQFLLFGYLVVIYFNIMWVVIQFVYRYTFICLREAPEKARRLTVKVRILAVIWGAFGIYMCYRICSPAPEFQPHALYVLKQNRWDIADSTPIVVGTELNSWTFIAWIMMWTVSCVGSSAVVVVYELKMKSHFDAASVQHDATRRMHKDFHRTLLAMAICPLITTSVPILYYMKSAYTGTFHGPEASFITLCASLITLLNPLLTMYFMRSYREVLLRPFKKFRKSVGQVSATRVTGLEVATRLETPVLSA